MGEWPVTYKGVTTADRYLPDHINSLRKPLTGPPWRNAKEEGASGAGSGDDTADLQALIDDAIAGGDSCIIIPPGRYRVSNLTVDYSEADIDSTASGHRAITIRGLGKRNTRIEQISGSTGPVLSLIGGVWATNPNSHNGKLTGALVEGLEIVGVTGGGAGVYASRYQDLVLRDLWITKCGADAIQLDRPTKTAEQDDHSHFFHIDNCKLFQNEGGGVVCVADNAIGPGLLTNVEASYNDGIGFDLVSAGIVLEECLSLGNGGIGLRLQEAANHPTSVALGFTATGSRFEGNDTYEAQVLGGLAPVFVSCVFLGTGGAHCLVIGDGDDVVRSPVVVGGIFAGDGSTSGQWAIRLGANCNGADIVSPRIDPSEFADAVSSGDPWLAVSNAGVASLVRLGGAIRSSLVLQGTSSGSLALEARLFALANRRFALYLDGKQEWGPGSAAVDTNLYRSAANVLKTDDQLVAVDGLATKVVAGAVDDGDFTATPPDGAIAVDSSNNRLYVRVGGVWKYAALT